MGKLWGKAGNNNRPVVKALIWHTTGSTLGQPELGLRTLTWHLFLLGVCVFSPSGVLFCPLS